MALAVRRTLLTALIGIVFISVSFFIPSLNHILQQSELKSIIERSINLQNNLSILSDDERIKYYMGKWYDDSLYFNASPSEWMGSLHKKTTKWSIFDKASYEYNISTYYWNDFFIFLNLSNEQTFECAKDVSKQAIFEPYDTTSKVEHIPIFVKVREVGRNYPIPLQLFTYERHWFVSSQMHFNETLYNEPLWNNKNNVAIWRGAHTGTDRLWRNKSERLSFVEQYFDSDSSMIDVGFVEPHFCKYVDFDVVNCSVIEALNKELVTYQDMLKNKFLISIEGNDVATNLKWILLSNSCPFMPIPTRESWAMEGLLKPYVHFIPISQNKSTGKWNLEQQIEYCLKNDEECDKIAQNGKKFMIGNNFFNVEHELRLQQQILDRYCQQYHIISG